MTRVFATPNVEPRAELGSGGGGGDPVELVGQALQCLLDPLAGRCLTDRERAVRGQEREQDADLGPAALRLPELDRHPVAARAHARPHKVFVVAVDEHFDLVVALYSQQVAGATSPVRGHPFAPRQSTHVTGIQLGVADHLPYPRGWVADDGPHLDVLGSHGGRPPVT
ncbi:hypothetical protein GCM10029964_042930 [Kibdelosporangium lantanae]